MFNELHKEIDNSILLLVGQGPLMEEMKEKVKLLGLEKVVRFLGQRDDVNELYQVFDVFCLPSLYEGLPVVGVEAQATGLLCFFSDNVTKDIKLLNTTKIFSLQKKATYWSTEIIGSYKKFQRKDLPETISNQNFNIKIETKKLEQLYLKYKEGQVKNYDL